MRIVTFATLVTLAMAQAAWAGSRSTDATLERLLDDRQAGKPLDCLHLRTVRSSTIIDGTAIVFESGGTLYLNRPKAGADLLVGDKAILTSSDSGQICSGESVQLFDTASGIQSGSVFLGRFVPYRKKPYQDTPHQAPARGY